LSAKTKYEVRRH